MITLRAHLDGTFAGLRDARYSWWLHWRELANFILPRRYNWLVTPNQANRGNPINTRILDNTGTMAARVLAAGMMEGITSPARPWFRMKIEGYDDDTTNPVNLWLEEVQRRIYRVMAESNFYTALATMYMDLVVFGTAVMIIYEDFDDVIRCYTPCAGEYFLGLSDRLSVDTMGRELVQTQRQTYQWFGDRCSEAVQQAAKRGDSNAQLEISVSHLIEPNTGEFSPDSGARSVPKNFPWRECYWETGGNEKKVLRERGFFEQPFIAARWDLASNDAYGRSPGMDALGDIKQLQQETLRKAQAIDKLTNPPMLADISLKNMPASLLPGGITYVAGLNTTAHSGMRPAYQVMPPVGELMQDITEIQARIGKTFYNDLFLMISQLDTVRTATEIDARREEKLIQLGPVLGRFNVEGLDPAINRIFGIMTRMRLLPPPPPEIQGQNIQITYSSMLAEAQRAVASTGIERLLANTAQLAAVQPDAMDNIDIDESIDELALNLNVSPRLIRSRKDLEIIRAGRAAQELEEKTFMLGMAGVEAAKTASETPVGGGQSALDLMLGG